MFTLLVYTILIISSVTACTPLQKYFQTPTELNFSGYFDLQKASTNAYIVKHSNFHIGPQRAIIAPTMSLPVVWCSCNCAPAESHLP